MKGLDNILYMLREISSLFFSLFSLLLVAWLTCLFLGEKYYAAFMLFLEGGFSLSFLSVTFIFSLIHTASWFSALPKAIDLRIQGKEFPEKYVITLCYVGFFAVTGSVLFLAATFLTWINGISKNVLLSKNKALSLALVFCGWNHCSFFPPCIFSYFNCGSPSTFTLEPILGLPFHKRFTHQFMGS